MRLLREGFTNPPPIMLSHRFLPLPQTLATPPYTVRILHSGKTDYGGNNTTTNYIELRILPRIGDHTWKSRSYPAVSTIPWSPDQISLKGAYLEVQIIHASADHTWTCRPYLEVHTSTRRSYIELEIIRRIGLEIIPRSVKEMARSGYSSPKGEKDGKF